MSLMRATVMNVHQGRGVEEGDVTRPGVPVEGHLEEEEVLTEEDLRGLVSAIATQHPDFVFDVLNKDNNQEGGHHPSPSSSAPN